jgi:hypothetical protein
MSPSPIVKAILAGEADDDFDAVVRAVNARARALRDAAGAAVSAALKVGDRVRLNDETRPAKMAGLEGDVTAFTRTKVSVRLDGHLTDTNCPPTFLTKIADAVVETADEARDRMVAAFKAKHDQYPQYEGRTDGAVAVPLRKAFSHRGMRLAKGAFVLLMPYDAKNPGQSTPGATPWSETAHDGTERISIWHPNLLMTTITDRATVVMPVTR